jgi:hypothetical protein
LNTQEENVSSLSLSIPKSLAIQNTNRLKERERPHGGENRARSSLDINFILNLNNNQIKKMI